MRRQALAKMHQGDFIRTINRVKRLFEKLAWSRRTIARDLTFRLVITITLVFGFAGSVNYFYSVDRDTAALHDKAKEIMDNLASVLVTPMWNLNIDELNKVVDVYRQSGIVLDIKLIDDAGETLVAPKRDTEMAYLEMTRIIHHEKTPIGRVTVAFSDNDIVAKQKEIAIYSILVFAFLTIALIFATSFLLKRYLNEPFAKLEGGLEVISAGDYAHQFEEVPQEDINSVTRKVTWMAGEIAKREHALTENRTKLEVLNQAILDIFSCSDTETLIRTAMALTHKVCGVDHGWFMAAPSQGGAAEEGPSAPPRPIIAVRGHIFEATTKEVAPHIGKAADHPNRVFSFPIKSRYRDIGDMTLSFDQVPDSSVTSLLKSLMSLTTVAMIRQSFIRETAFIAAELQVAEAVQRSMLPDEARLPANAVVSYHYEPVLRVGGDWFSIIESRDGDSVFVILGDVTGHGLAQGLVTTAMAGAIQVVEAIIRDAGAEGVSKPSQIVTLLGQVISRIAGTSNLRMTCVAAQLDFKEAKLHICNAGHTFPLALHHGDGTAHVESLAKNQQHMLGEESFTGEPHVYSDATYELAADDILLFYTDGLTEALDKDGKAFNRKFQRHFSKSTNRRSVAQIRDELIELFRAHTGDVACKDDICVLVVGKKPDRALRVAS